MTPEGKCRCFPVGVAAVFDDEQVDGIPTMMSGALFMQHIRPRSGTQTRAHTTPNRTNQSTHGTPSAGQSLSESLSLQVRLIVDKTSAGLLTCKLHSSTDTTLHHHPDQMYQELNAQSGANPSFGSLHLSHASDVHVQRLAAVCRPSSPLLNYVFRSTKTVSVERSNSPNKSIIQQRSVSGQRTPLPRR